MCRCRRAAARYRRGARLTDEGLTLPALSALPLSAIIGSVELFDCVDVDDVPEDFDDAGFAGGPSAGSSRPEAAGGAVRVQGCARSWTPPSSLTTSAGGWCCKSACRRVILVYRGC